MITWQQLILLFLIDFYEGKIVYTIQTASNFMLNNKTRSITPGIIYVDIIPVEELMLRASDGMLGSNRGEDFRRNNRQ